MPTPSPELRESIVALPLSVVFADGDAIAALRRSGEGSLPLSPPFHVSDEDAYLVLPDDVGLEIVDMFADGDLDLIDEALRDGVVAIGVIEKQGRGVVALHVEEWAGARDLLVAGLPYGADVRVEDAEAAIADLNDLEHARITVSSELVDARGLQDMLRAQVFAGKSWRVPPGADHLRGVEPTYVYSKRLANGGVGMEAVLFSEYEELVIVLRPALLELPGLRLVQSDAAW